MATVQPGSFLTLHYRLAGPAGDIINTFDDKPATLSLGTGELAPAMEARLIGLTEGTRATFELPAGEAFGMRNPELLRFVDQLLSTLDMKELWGGNFALGYRREGDVPFLRHQGELKGFTVETLVEPVLYDGEIISSRRVRAALEAGEMGEVTACLGRYFCVRGPVVKGDQRGRTIGFPTANVAVWDELLLPTNGVYATYIWIGEARHLAATNVGVRPTVDGMKLTVEAHILDFDADIYGEDVRLEFVRRVRPEMKFAGLDALKAQIAADVEEVREGLC